MRWSILFLLIFVLMEPTIVLAEHDDIEDIESYCADGGQFDCEEMWQEEYDVLEALHDEEPVQNDFTDDADETLDYVIDTTTESVLMNGISYLIYDDQLKLNRLTCQKYDDHSEYTTTSGSCNDGDDAISQELIQTTYDRAYYETYQRSSTFVAVETVDGVLYKDPDTDEYYNRVCGDYSEVCEYSPFVGPVMLASEYESIQSSSNTVSSSVTSSIVSSSSTSYATCTYCSLIDEAWKVAGNSQVYVPGTGLVNYDTVYPPVTVSSSSSFSSSYSGSSTTISGKAVYGASSTCTQTSSTLVKGQSGNTRLDTYAEEWSEALALQGLVGTTWIGVMDHNGKTDSTGLTTTGRLTIIFAPCTTNFANPVEIMYYWHGIKGFSYTTTGTTFNDFNERMAPQSKSMSVAGRNFVLVFPEMPWSGGDRGMYSSRNTDSRSTAVWSGDDGLVSMHSEALGYIRSNMGTPSVSLVSIVGHSKGGHPLQIAGANGQLRDLGPQKITLSDADYWDSSKAVWEGYVSSNNNVEFNLISQHQDNGGAHNPTYWTINFLKNLGDPVTSSWTLSSYDTRKDPTASTPGASRGEVYTLTSYPNINYYPHSGSHSDIGAMSLSFVAPSRSTSVSNLGDCPISSGTSESIGTPSDGYMTGPVPVRDSNYIESRSAHNQENYGVIELVNMLEKTACDMAWTNTKLSIADLSKGSGTGTGGHDIDGHNSHESGRDVDTRLYAYENGNYLMQGQLCEASGSRCIAGKVDSKFNNDQALEANYKYIKALHTHGDVRVIGFDIEYQKLLDAYAQRMYGESDFSSTHKIQNWVNHHHHYHIRINCPEGDTRCSG